MPSVIAHGEIAYRWKRASGISSLLQKAIYPVDVLSNPVEFRRRSQVEITHFPAAGGVSPRAQDQLLVVPGERSCRTLPHCFKAANSGAAHEVVIPNDMLGWEIHPLHLSRNVHRLPEPIVAVMHQVRNPPGVRTPNRFIHLR